MRGVCERDIAMQNRSDSLHAEYKMVCSMAKLVAAAPHGNSLHAIWCTRRLGIQVRVLIEQQNINHGTFNALPSFMP